jgi:hypothetical protein
MPPPVVPIRALDCSPFITEGMICWDTDNDKLYVGTGAAALELGTAGATTFLALTDTPASYATFGGQYVKVNAGATALEFTAATVAGHTILDSTVHTDALTGTVVRGDLIIGNSTPKWSRLAKSASGSGLISGTNDIGWSSWYTFGTAAQSYTFPTTTQYLAPNPLTTIGDLPYANSTATPAGYGRIAAVAIGQVLASAGTGTAPVWSASPQVTSIELGHATDTTLARSAAGIVTIEGAYVALNPATTIGDLIYASSTATPAALSRLADVAAGSYLRSGGVGAAPLWSTLLLPNSGTIYKLAAYTAANTLTELGAVGATGQLLVGATGGIPTWSVTTLTDGTNAFTITNGTVSFLVNTSGTIGSAAYTSAGAYSPIAGSSSIVTVGALTAGSLATGFTPVTVPLGGTGASTYALNGVLYGNAANAIGVTAIGAEGQLLRVGASPFVPAWTTATWPATVADGSVLATNAANTMSAITWHAAGTKVLTNASGTISWEDAAAPGAHAIVGASHTLAAATAGTILRASAADAFTWTTSTFADTYAVGTVLHAGTANTITGLAPGAIGSFLMSNGTGAALTYLAPGAATYILVGAGVTTIPVWTAPTGTGSPVLGTSPTFTTQLTTPKIASVGNLTIDAVNAAANSTVAIGNSAATYVADVTVDGGLEIEGLLKAGTSHTTLTDAAGKVLSAALNTVAVGQGGTGATSFTANSYLKGNTTSALIERTYNEVKTDLSLNNVENTALSTWTGAATIATVGTISSGVWTGTAITAVRGGTGQTAYTIGDLLYADSTTTLGKLGIGTSGYVLTSAGAGAAPAWATPAAAAAHVLDSASHTITGKTAGQVLRATAATTFGFSTSTFADTYTIGGLLVASGANTVTGLATGTNGQILLGVTGAVPAWGTDLATATTIGTAYIHRVGGTDVAVADGGTGKSTYTLYSIPYMSGTTTFGEIAIGTAGQYLKTNAGANGYDWGTPAGAGDVISVGDCTDGACLDAHDAGAGTYIDLYSATAITRLVNTSGVMEAKVGATAAYASFKAADITTVAVNGSNRLTITNNTAIAPTASVNEIYPEANIWKINENGTEYSIVLGATGSPIKFAGALTSGGIPYASAANTITSTGALTQYGVLYGGGAGNPPVAVTPGTTGQVLAGTTGGAPIFTNLATLNTPSRGGTGVAQASDLSTITITGAYPLTMTLGVATSVNYSNFPSGVSTYIKPSATTIVPIGGDINTYITAATAGDTLMLSSGTYTITSAINVSKQLNIVGQGSAGQISALETDVHGTRINVATAGIDAFNITSSNVRIAHLSLDFTSAATGTTRGFVVANNLDGITFNNVDVNFASCAGAKTAFDILGSTAVIRACTFNVTSNNLAALGVYYHNDSSTTGAKVLDVYLTYGHCIAGNTRSSAYWTYNNNDTDLITMNIYNSTGYSATGTANDDAAATTSTTSSAARMNVYGCFLSGADADVSQGGTNTITIYGGILVNNTTAGSPTYGGTVAASAFTGTITNATNVSMLNESTDTTCFPAFLTDSTPGNFPLKTVSTLTFNSNTGALGATSFSGSASGLTSLPAANLLIASQAVGDLLYASSGTVWSRLPDVAAGQPLLSGGVTTAPAYAGYTFAGTASQTYTFPTTTGYLAPNPLTTIGDIPYANTTATPAAYGRIAAVAAGQVLTSAGTGTVPAWSASPSITALTVTGANPGIVLGTASGNRGEILLHNASNAYHFEIFSGASGADLSWTLPIAAPAGNSYLVTAATTGALSYTNPDTFSVKAGSSSIVTVGALSAGSLASGFTPVTVPLGGTGASTYALNGVLYGNAANAIGVTAIGAEGNILVVGASPFVPAWSAGTGTGVPARGTSPVFTTSILPSAAGATAIGTTALPFSSIFIGDAATNNVQLINTAAASAVVLTLPSTSGTLARLEDKISDLAAVTSAELYGKVSDETGSASGSPLLVFNQGPTLVAPALGAATATSLIATGIVDGTAPIVITATSAGYTLGATYKSGYTFAHPVAAAASFTMTLPVAAAGLQYCVGNYAAHTGTLTVWTNKPGGAGTQYIDLDGVLTANTGNVHATAVAGNLGCFIGLDANNWKFIPTKGTWAKGP